MCRKIVWFVEAFVTACAIVARGSWDRPREAESEPPELFTYQTMPVKVTFRGAVALAGVPVPPLSLETVYVHVEDVAPAFGV